ncbi:hypothetical protein FACS189490_10110 [Clostridia bacterium]|nr:hypothetical protein FACS189490_10110 [Clostridia bacterium]
MRKLDNNGSGLITVIVIVGALLALAGSVLFGSYIQSTMASTNKRTSVNFYDLETDVLEAADVREMLSDAISKAYKYQLEHWFDEPQPPAGFYAELERLLKLETLDTAFLTKWASLLSGDVNVEKSGDDFFLNGLKFATVNRDYTDIYARIKISPPDFEAGKMPEFTQLCEIVARDLIIDRDVNLKITGDLWVRDIIVKNGATLTLEARNIYVSDDLELYGNANVTIICKNYIGHGDDTDVETKSSAILIHDPGTSNLDLSRVDNLYLAGHAFVREILPRGPRNPDDPREFAVDAIDVLRDGPIKMGSSISVTLEQLLYFVNEGDLEYENSSGDKEDVPNPEYFASDESDDVRDKFYANVSLKTGKTLPVGAVGVTKRIYPAGDGGYLVYYLYNFEDNQTARNNYYKSKFGGTDGFETIIKKYLAIYNLPESNVRLSDGISITGSIDALDIPPLDKSFGGVNIREKHSYDYYTTAFDLLTGKPGKYYSDTNPVDPHGTGYQLFLTRAKPAVAPYPYEMHNNIWSSAELTAFPSKALEISGMGENDKELNLTIDTTGNEVLSGGLLAVEGDIRIESSTIDFGMKYVSPEGIPTGSAWDLNNLISVDGWTKNEEITK